MNESIKFEITLVPTYWLSPPMIKISIDSEDKFNGPVIDRQTISFTQTLGFNAHTLKIVRSGNTNQQVRMLSTGEYQGQGVLLEQIKIDGVNIRNLIWTNSYYEPEYPEPWASQQKAQGIELETRVRGETNFSHNGTWTLNFTSPFYKFLMDWMG